MAAAEHAQHGNNPFTLFSHGFLSLRKERTLTPAAALAFEVERATSGKDPAFAAKTARDVTDLFVGQSIFLREPEVSIFDEVLLRLLPHLEINDRIALAERLADIGNAPRKLVSRLALSEPAVAAPVLERSQRLSDQELLTIGSATTQSHLHAIASRSALGCELTDFVISRGSPEVLRVLAQNPGASISAGSFELLIERSRKDDLLFRALQQREDITPDNASALLRRAGEDVRSMLQGDLEGLDRRNMDEILSQIVRALRHEIPDTLTSAFEAARLRVRQQVLESDLTSETLADWIGEGALHDALAGVAQLARVAPGAALGAFEARGADAMATLARAAGLPRETAAALLGLRVNRHNPSRGEGDSLAFFDALTMRTARGLLRFVETSRKLDKAA